MNMDVSPNSLVDKIKNKLTKMQEIKKVLQSNLSDGIQAFRYYFNIKITMVKLCILFLSSFTT